MARNGNGTADAGRLAQQQALKQAREQTRLWLDSSFWVDGAEYRWGDLEYGELELIELGTGQSAGEFDLLSAAVQIHLLYVIRRRHNPDLTLDDVRRIKFSEMLEITEPEWDDAGDAPAASKAAAKLAGDIGVDLADVAPTGRNNTITIEDVRKASRSRASATPAG